MLNGIDLKNKEIEFSALLYKNSRELIGIIPSKSVKSIIYKFEDCHEIDIEIDKYMMTEEGTKKVLNPLYAKINSRQQVVINNKDRFILIDKTTVSDKRKGIKTFKGYSMEYTLNKRRVGFEGKERQLYREIDEVDSEIGILNILEDETGWKVNYISENAKKEEITKMETVDFNICNNYSSEQMVNEIVLFEEDVAIEVGEGIPLIMEVNFVNITSFDLDDDEEIFTEELIIQKIEPLYTGIKHIKCSYDTTQPDNRYTLKYEFTLYDDVVKVINKKIRNMTDMKIQIENIFIRYELGIYSTQIVNKYRYFESVDTNWLSFLRDEVQQAYNIVFFFNTMNKTISAYSRDEVGNVSNIYLSYDSCMQESTFTEITDEVCTRLRVISSNNVYIYGENILGTDYVECFDYLIKKGTISEGLLNALERYEAQLEVFHEQWLFFKNQKLSLETQKIKVEAEIKTLNEQIKTQNDLLTVYIANNEEEMQLITKEKIEELQARAEECLYLMTNITNGILKASDRIEKLTTSMKKENISDEMGNIFDEDLLDEYNTESIIESTYNDSFYTTESELYNYAKEHIKELNKLKFEFTPTLDDLNKLIRDKDGFQGKINLGDFVIIGEKEIIDEVEGHTLRLVEYQMIPSEKCKIGSIKFTNGDKSKQALKSLSGWSKKTNNINNITGRYKNVWNESIDNNSFVKTFKENGLDLSSQGITGSGTQSQIDISECGVFITNKSNKKSQAYIGSNLYAISTDGFKTSTVAIMPEGINASILVNKILLSEKLSIGNEEDTFIIDSNGLTIKEIGENGEKINKIFVGIEEVNGVKKATLKIIGNNGELCLSENGVIVPNQFVVWDNVSPSFPIQFPYVVDESVVSCKKVLLTLILEKYRAFEKGVGSGEQSTATTTTGGSSTQTTSAGGGQTTSAGGSSSPTSENTNNWGVGWVYKSDEEKYVLYTTSVDNQQYIYQESLGHNHITNIIEHSHNISDHTHLVEIPNHSHDVIIAEHYHDIQYGISEGSLPTNVKVYVNDVLVVDNINLNTQIDITNNVVLNSTNNIKIESDTNGRISCNLFTKNFVSF